MSKYVPTWEYKTTFEGDDVRVTLRPLTRLGAMRFAGVEVESAINAELMQLYESVVRESVVELNGLRDAQGINVTLDSVLRDAYFTSLIIDIGAELVRKASPANPA